MEEQMYNPIVIDTDGSSERAYDIYSRLLKDRIIFLGTDINAISANSVIAQLLFLEAQSDEDIKLYINSVGGEVYSGLAIYDTIQHIKVDVSTICVGLSASMAAILLAAGKKGKRYILPNARVMIHQPLGGVRGQASDISIQAQEILRIKSTVESILVDHTSQPLEVIQRDTERDKYLSAQEAVNYGLVDDILRR